MLKNNFLQTFSTVLYLLDNKHSTAEVFGLMQAAYLHILYYPFDSQVI